MQPCVRALVALGVAVVCSVLAAPAAEAAFPGQNGVIAFSRKEASGPITLAAVDPRSGRTRQLTHAPRRCQGRPEFWVDMSPTFSASGRRVAYVHEDICDRQTANGIYIMRADGSHRRLIERPGDEFLQSPAFSPSGRLLAYSQYVEATFIKSVRGVPHRERRLRVSPERYLAVQPTWGSDGRLAVALSGAFDGEGDRGHIAIIGRRGRVRHLITRSKRDAMPDWSPAGDSVAFHRLTTVRETEGSEFVQANIFVASARADRARPRRLTDSRHTFYPTWSPDGREIAYVLRENNEIIGDGSVGTLWVMNARNGAQERPIVTGVVANKMSWQPRPRR